MKRIRPFRTILHQGFSSPCMFFVCHQMVVPSASVGALSWGGELLVADKPSRTPAHVLYHSSFTPPLFRSQSVLCFRQQVLTPSSPKPEVFRKLKGTRHILFGILRQWKTNQNPFIFLGEFP